MTSPVCIDRRGVLLSSHHLSGRLRPGTSNAALLRAMAGPDGLVADKENQPQLDKSKPLVGSVQQFISNKGAMRNQPLEVKGKIPAQDCQKIAILDTITLNVDRHGGNLMINDESGTPNLVPIDHGLTFPPAEARKELP